VNLSQPRSEERRLAFLILLSGLLHLVLLASLSGGALGGGFSRGARAGAEGQSLGSGWISVARLWEGSESPTSSLTPSPALPGQSEDAILPLPPESAIRRPSALEATLEAEPGSHLKVQPEPGEPSGQGSGNGQGSEDGQGSGAGGFPLGSGGPDQGLWGPGVSPDQEQDPAVEPSIAFCPKPKYPDLARHRRLEGTVRLQFEVLPDGSAGDVFVVQSSGFQELDQAALQNIKKECKFFPGRKGGVPVTRRAERTIRFRLEEAE